MEWSQICEKKLDFFDLLDCHYYKENNKQVIAACKIILDNGLAEVIECEEFEMYRFLGFSNLQLSYQSEACKYFDLFLKEAPVKHRYVKTIMKLTI